MADSVAKLVVKVLKRDCSEHSCPYRYENEQDQKRLEEALTKALKHRVADGNEVRALEKRIKELEKELFDLKMQIIASKKGNRNT